MSEKPSLQEKLSNDAETLGEMVTIVNNKMNEWHRRRAWKTKMVPLEDIEKAVRSCASSIDSDAKIWVLKIQENMEKDFPKYRQWGFVYRDGFMDGYKEGYLKAKEEDRKLLVGSDSPPLTKTEIEDVEVSLKEIREGEVFKSDNVEEVIAELKREDSPSTDDESEEERQERINDNKELHKRGLDGK